MWIRTLIVAGVLAGVQAAAATTTAGEPRFPHSVSDQTLLEFVRIGRVEATTPREPDGWLRWGGAPLEHQVSAMRAVVDALSAARPPIGLAAAIMAIARIESGWNPYSRNPTSTACGLFQFVRATWARYDDSQQRCFDPNANARAGVKHLMSLYTSRIAPRIALITPLTTETERRAWTYRMLFALHYHGEAAPEAAEGGSIVSHSVAHAGTSHLEGFFTLLRKTTATPPRVRVASRTRRGGASGGPKAVRRTKATKSRTG
jgi:hypothetical protein